MNKASYDPEMTTADIADTTANQYLTFMLAEEQYGIDILRVQEINGWVPVTHLPNMPDFVKGVLNLRGSIVPIIDLRLRFNLEPIDYTLTTVVIVLSVKTGNHNHIFGIVVDAVSDVLNIPPEDVRPKPEFGTAVDTDFIRGLATVGEQMTMLLDIDRLLRIEEIETIATLSEEN